MSLKSWLTTWRQAYLLLAAAALAAVMARLLGVGSATFAQPGSWMLAAAALLLLGATLGALATGARTADRWAALGAVPASFLPLGLAYAGLAQGDIPLAGFGAGLMAYLACLHLGACVPPEVSRQNPAPWLGTQLLALVGGYALAQGLLATAGEGVPALVAGQRLVYLLLLLGGLSALAQISLVQPRNASPGYAPLSGEIAAPAGTAVGSLLCAGLLSLAVLGLGGEAVSPALYLRVTATFLAGLTSGVLLLACAFPALGRRAELLPVGYLLCVTLLAAHIPLSLGEIQSYAVLFLLGESVALLMLPAMSTSLRVSPGAAPAAPHIPPLRTWVGVASALALAGVATLILERGAFGLPELTPGTRMLLLAAAALPLGFASLFLFREAAVAVAKFFFGTFVYHVTAQGRENLPPGGFVLIPNHVTWVDSIILHLASPRPIRFLMLDTMYNIPWLKPINKMMGALPISNTRAKEGLRLAADAVKAGEIVCIFPEGSLTRSGQLMRLHKGFQIIARQAECPVVPVWMDSLWGSIFSFRGGKYFRKWPKRVPYPVIVKFGQPIPAREASEELVRERMLQLSADCYHLRPALRRHIGREAIASLKRNQFRELITDGMDDSTMKAGMLLAAGIALSRKISKEVTAKRVSIVLPPGKGGMIANLAVMLANKVPVNLNFTAGRAALESAIRRAEIKDCVTALAVQRKLEDIPWPENVIALERVIPGLKKSVILWRLAVLVLPASWIAALLGLPKEGGEAEATILFTSGSSGEPKGVVLSHRNVLGNVEQFDEVLDLERSQKVLASLPIFHSFGCTVTLWWPLCKGQPVVTYPSPLEVTKNAELIEKYKISLMIATPTFLRGYLRRAKPEQLASLDLLVSGAEKLPVELADKFKERFGAQILEGYGLTETSPVVSVNMPDRKPYSDSATDVQIRLRMGSVGRPMPGLAIQVRDPDSGEVLPLYQTGMLWYRGINIFEGYLNDAERTAEVIQEQWFKSGDLGRMDEDGFLFIEGRLSRFSKIAGEMVPHATVETAIIKVLGLEGEDSQPLVVMGVPDEAKGEALVILSTLDIDLTDLRKKLNEEGIANLWVPKQVKRIEAVPLLASGKLDLKACGIMAREEGAAAPTSAAPAPAPTEA